MSFWLALNSLGSPDLKQLPAYEEPPPEWLVRNVIRWLPLIHRWHPDFPELDPALILGIMAQESQGDPYAEADDLWGSTGLLQIGPRSWTGTREQLRNPAFNIYVGMRMFSDTLKKSDGNILRALGAYNCGFVGLNASRCGERGGLAYAERIINYWLPVFHASLWIRAGETDDLGMWLRGVGYGEGFGYWLEREEYVDKLRNLSLVE